MCCVKVKKIMKLEIFLEHIEYDQAYAAEQYNNRNWLSWINSLVTYNGYYRWGWSATMPDTSFRDFLEFIEFLDGNGFIVNHKIENGLKIYAVYPVEIWGIEDE